MNATKRLLTDATLAAGALIVCRQELMPGAQGEAVGSAEHCRTCFPANIDASATVNRTDNSVTVYITKSGGKYYRYSCGYLSNKTK